MSYTQTYDTSLGQVPQVCLSKYKNMKAFADMKITIQA